MDIAIIANFVAELDGGANSRFTYLAEMLCKDHTVELITSDFSHGQKRKRECDTSRFPYKVTLLHEPGYPKNICLKRFKSHMVWGQAVTAYMKIRKKPDVIYCAVPSLTGPAKVASYCKKNGVRFIIDIQDLWPEAFQMVLNVPILSKLIFAPFKMVADRIYCAADEVIAVSQTYVDRAMRVNRKAKDGHSVFLGTRLATFDQNVANHPIRKNDPGEIWIGYCGTLGSSYDICCVIDALTIIHNTKIRFIVMGDGPYRGKFETYAHEKGTNVEFTGRLPYPAMCGKLASCDIVINPITHGAAQSIINKHADYAACGLPVINTQESPEYRKLVADYNMGFNCENGNAPDMAEKLENLMNDAELRQEMGRNARRCAEEKFDRENTYQDILKVIQK